MPTAPIARVQRIIDILADLTEEELLVLHAALGVMIGVEPPKGMAVTDEPPEPTTEDNHD
jgi:hypothetical protein